MTTAKAVAFPLIVLGFCFLGFAALLHLYSSGYKNGFEAGKAEAQTPAFIVETCANFWFGNQKESSKALDKFCKQKK